jgi:hypothetical protein
MIKGAGKMGKYFASLILAVITLFVLEWFGIVDIPYVDLPDLTAGKQHMIQQNVENMDNMG